LEPTGQEPTTSGKNKTLKLTDQHDIRNDSDTQQRQCFTDMIDKNGSW